MASKNYLLTPELASYVQSISLREPEILQRLRQETQTIREGKMQISPELGQFMRLMVSLTKAKNILELGVFTGYSTLSLALAIPDDGQILACDVSETWTNIARKYWQEAGVEHKINLRLSPALGTLKDLTNNTNRPIFDFIFLDADKPNYLRYYTYCIDLLKPNGLLLIDNTLWEFKVNDPEYKDSTTQTIRTLNDQIHKDERVDVSILLFCDGLTLLRKR